MGKPRKIHMINQSVILSGTIQIVGRKIGEIVDESDTEDPGPTLRKTVWRTPQSGPDSSSIMEYSTVLR